MKAVIEKSPELELPSPVEEIDHELGDYVNCPEPPVDEPAAAPTPPAKPDAAHAVDAHGENPFRWFILAGLITAAILQVLDTTIVNVCLPQMAGNLGATNEEIGWVITGYILSNVIFLPLTAFFTERFGRKKYLSVSILVFIAASFFCGTSHSLGEIVFWRIVQGAGGAALLATAQATLVQVFPPREQGFVQSMFMMGLTVAPTLGPTLGGWITDNYTWNWCFLINVPIGLIAAALVITFLHDTVQPAKGNPVDWLGIGLLAMGLGAMQYVLEEGQQNDWFQDTTILSLTWISVICIVGLIFWQLSPKNKNPVVDFRVMGNKIFSACMFLFVALGFGLYAGTYLFPLLAQTVLGFTSMQTGLALLPGGCATALSIILCGAILNRPKQLIDTRIVILFGTILLMTSMWMLGGLTPQSGEGDTTLALLVRGFGMGFIFVPLNQVAFASLKKTELTQGSGLLSLARQLGGSFGIAALATYVTNSIQTHRAHLLTNYSAANPVFIDRLHAYAGGLMSHGFSPASSQTGALALLDHGLMIQAMSMSYNDAFLLMLAVNLITLPAVLILRKAKTAAPVPMHVAE